MNTKGSKKGTKNTQSYNCSIHKFIIFILFVLSALQTHLNETAEG